MKLFVKILLLIFTMLVIMAVEAKSSTEVTILHKETSYSFICKSKLSAILFENHTANSFLNGENVVTYCERVINVEGSVAKGGMLKKVVLGSDDLSKYAIEFRKELKVPNHRGNVAVFEYIDNNGNLAKRAFTTLEESTLHAEEIAIDFFKSEKIPSSNIKRIFSELEPCEFEEHFCKKLLSKDFPNAQVTYSYSYPGGNNAPIEIITIRRESVQKRFDDLINLLK